jgi:hypothetical protein
MKFSLRSIIPVTLAMLCLVLPFPGQANEPAPVREENRPALAAMAGKECSCQEALAQLEGQNKKISDELRGIKRDIAALKQSIAEPGIPAAMAGIGYIFGLFGVAAFMASRRKNQPPRT